MSLAGDKSAQSRNVTSSFAAMAGSFAILTLTVASLVASAEAAYLWGGATSVKDVSLTTNPR